MILVFMPKVVTAIPAPLVVIVLLTVVVVVFGVHIPNVGDQGELPDSLPQLFVPNVPFSCETLTTIAPYAMAMAMVGLLESLMTAKLVDDITDSHSNKTREAFGQGRRKHRHRPVRRHGRVRDDRPDDDQRQGLGRPYPDLDLPRRRVPAGPRRRVRWRRRQDPDGRAGRRHDHGLGRNDGLAQRAPANAAADADQRDDDHGRDR